MYFRSDRANAFTATRGYIEGTVLNSRRQRRSLSGDNQDRGIYIVAIISGAHVILIRRSLYFQCYLALVRGSYTRFDLIAPLLRYPSW